MKKSTKKALGAALLGLAVVGGVILYKRSTQPGLSTEGFTTGQLKHARHVRQMAAWMGKDISPKTVVEEKVLANGMTQGYARKYMAWLNDRAQQRGKSYTHKHISPSSLALPTDEAVR